MLWRKALRYWTSILVVCAITYVSLLREVHVSLPPIEGIDKWAHGLMYMVLAVVLLWDSQKAGVVQATKWVLALAFPIIYGGLIEILQEQYFFPRTGDWMDWIADCIGTGMGVLIWIIGEKIHARRMAQ